MNQLFLRRIPARLKAVYHILFYLQTRDHWKVLRLPFQNYDDTLELLQAIPEELHDGRIATW